MSSKKDIGHILSQLKKSDRFEKRAAPRETDALTRPTSFGIPLRQAADNHFCIDMSDIRMFAGIPELAMILTDQFFEQCRTGATDILVQHALNQDINPELAQAGVHYITISARHSVAVAIQRNRTGLTDQLHAVINALQNKRVRDTLFGSDETGDPIAWLFPFNEINEDTDCFMLLEYEPGEGFIRLTVEFGEDNRLFLKRIPHRTISAQEHNLYQQDINKLVELIQVGIYHACQNQRESYTEEPRHQPAVFEMLSIAGLDRVTIIRFCWINQRMTRFLLGDDPSIQELISKILILLEDTTVLQTLANHHVVELISNQRRAFLHVTRRGACLNIALDQQSKPVDLDTYLSRMPHLDQWVTHAGTPLTDIRVLFIHHLTSETLGAMRALQKLGCAHLHGLFIRYKGITPDAYLEALFSLPEQQFEFHSLHNLGDEESLKGHFVLSRQFSPLSMLNPLPTHLRETPNDYFSAMRTTACHLFFRQIVQAKQNGERVLLIEDGGYIAPLLNIWSQNGLTVGKALANSQMDIAAVKEALPDLDLDAPLSDWLSDTFLASVEHTRNGYDQLAKVKRVCGQLSYPAYTMAISDYKNVEEGRGAAMSILMACEEIMNGQGDSMYCRHGMVIGSCGNIGRFVLSHLTDRVAPNQSVGIDIASGSNERSAFCSAPEYQTVTQIPDQLFLETDLIIGMTGMAALQPPDMQKLLLSGTKRRIYLVSGSTKNLEFSAVMDWLQQFRDNDSAIIGDRSVRLETHPLLDPLTENSQGTCIRVHFAGPDYPPGTNEQHPYKDILLLADGMPLNFNFFGVPSEIIDQVMQQLMQMCLLGATLPRSDNPPPGDLYVLDYTIDAAGHPITGRELP